METKTFHIFFSITVFCVYIFLLPACDRTVIGSTLKKSRNLTIFSSAQSANQVPDRTKQAASNYELFFRYLFRLQYKIVENQKKETNKIVEQRMGVFGKLAFVTGAGSGIGRAACK